jgi:hypothetical protein
LILRRSQCPWSRTEVQRSLASAKRGEKGSTYGSEAGSRIVCISKEIDANCLGDLAVVEDIIIDSSGLLAYIAQGTVE